MRRRSRRPAPGRDDLRHRGRVPSRDVHACYQLDSRPAVESPPSRCRSSRLERFSARSRQNQIAIAARLYAVEDVTVQSFLYVPIDHFSE